MTELIDKAVVSSLLTRYLTEACDPARLVPRQELLLLAQAQLNTLPVHSNRYAHMCRDEHIEIGHNDSEHEQCPLCREKAKADVIEEALCTALEESVKLQAHYARSLNDHDGGQRMAFESAAAWLERLATLARVQRVVLTARNLTKTPKTAEQAESELVAKEKELEAEGWVKDADGKWIDYVTSLSYYADTAHIILVQRQERKSCSTRNESDAGR